MAEQVAAGPSHADDVKTTETETKESSSPVSPTGSTVSAGGGGSWGLWGWVESAKTKSFSVLEAVKKDLDELSTVVKEEANAASEALGLHQPDSTMGVMKKSISSFLGQVSDVLVPPVDLEEEAEAIMITKDGMVSLTGFAKHLAELQANDATYLQEPTDVLLSQYKRWLEVIEQDQFTEPRLTRQLTSSQILNEKYLSLVPVKVSHMEFWKRYLFKRALLEDAVANAEHVAKKAEAEAASTDTVIPEKIVIQTEQPKMSGDEDELKKWEEDICASNIELSEEEQARLLEEYEKEIKEREPAPKEEPKPKSAPAKKQQQQQQPKGNTSKTAQAKSNNTNNPKATKSKPTKQQAAKQKDDASKEDTTSDESWEKDFDDVLDQQKK